MRNTAGEVLLRKAGRMASGSGRGHAALMSVCSMEEKVGQELGHEAIRRPLLLSTQKGSDRVGNQRVPCSGCVGPGAVLVSEAPPHSWRVH